MEAQRWEQVKDVLYQALEKPAAERLAFLDGACGDDPSLRAEVESLLGTETEAGNFIEQPVVERFPDETEDALPEQRRIGPYELVERLGRGGMGVVYLATRADREFDQKVAIKVVKRGMDTDEIVSRFRFERQILANLDHPSIARLFDGGTTSDGLPYFVMEYVEGEPIRRYCESRDLSTSERLRLFLDVCDAVHFAHQNLVVHRDLKPANILVTEDGAVKLLDFGIARLLDADGPSALTRQLGGRLMTREYASPEQLRGNPVTTVSDVYSLGILLYELLTGQRPFDDEGTGDFVLETARQQDPEKPSVVLGRKTREAAVGGKEGARRLRRRLAGDLDHIVLKALRSEPVDRYASVRELTEDIGRHLTGHPVMARKGAKLYVLSRYLRRNGRALAGAAVVLALIGVLARSVSDVASERQRAVSEYFRAEEMQELLRSTFMGADPERIQDEPPTLREILDQGARSVMSRDDVEPEARSSLLNALGYVYDNIGELKQAENVLDESLRLRREAYGDGHPLVGQSLNNLGEIYRSQGRYADAEQAFRDAIKIGRKFDPDPTRLPVYLHNLAALMRIYGSDMEEVIDLYEESLALKKKHYGEGAANADIAVTQNNLGNVWLALGEYEKAEPLYQEALAVRQSLRLKSDIATTFLSLGVLYRDRGDPREAEVYLRESLELRAELYEDSDPSRIAPVLRSLAVCLQLQGRWIEAEDLYRQALEIQREAWDGGNLETATILRELSQLVLEQGDALQAEGHAREALLILQRLLEEDHWRIADVKSVLGGALLAQGRREEARDLLEEGLAGLTAVRGTKIRWSREAKKRLAALEEGTDGPS